MAREYGKDKLLKLATDNEKSIRKFTRWRPKVKKNFDDLIKDIQNEEVTAKLVDPNEWDTYSKKYYGSDAPDNLAGWYDRNNNTIHTTDNEYGRGESMNHELMHYFASHQPGRAGVPDKINPYLKLDQKLGGWLPSIHPGGRRPTLKGKIGESPLGKWWNDNMATESVAYSDENNYHPWYDEHAFDRALPTEGGHKGHGHEEHPGVPHEEQEPPIEEEIPTKNKQGERQMSLSNWWAGNEGWLPDIGGKSTTQMVKDLTGAGPNEGWVADDTPIIGTKEKAGEALGNAAYYGGSMMIPGGPLIGAGLDYAYDGGLGYNDDPGTGGFGKQTSIREFNMEDPESVKKVQRSLGVKEDGMFGPKTEAAYRARVAEEDAQNPEQDVRKYDYNDQMAAERKAGAGTKLGGWLKNAWYNADKGLGGVLPGGYSNDNIMSAAEYNKRPAPPQ